MLSKFPLSSYAGIMCKGENRLLEEGVMLPSSSMWLNSCQAIDSRSGESHWVWAHTGRPVVMMWCVIWCFTVQLQKGTCVMGIQHEDEYKKYQLVWVMLLQEIME